jgi:8-oxo-dGTP pyrophosphatase MutT (NUDIX family)
MAREISAGGVVLRRMRGQWWMAAIHPQRQEKEKLAGARPPKPVFALPKGIVDPGEKPDQTASREVREETGLEADLVAKLGDIKYVYVRSWGDHERVFKIVSFYLFLYRGGKLGDIAPNMRHEVASAEWVPLDEAHRRLSYGGEREMARKAQEYVATHPEGDWVIS